MTFLAFSFCDLQLWHIVIAWLLPFILGLLLGYLLWFRYKNEKEALEKDKAVLLGQIADLEEEVKSCKHAKTVLDSEISSLKGRLRERNLQLTTLEASLAAAGKKGQEKGANVKKAEPDSINDDLKKIEGIGPKIEKALNSAGIRTFSQLANTSAEVIREILQASQGSFRLADPMSWSKQAKLAEKGAWDDLKDLQNKLSGGKEP